ncbi:MAG: 16S rRNA (cytidine(1402)-2'-O)-methyltransferase [Thermodesulfobacteriota bacterium]
MISRMGNRLNNTFQNGGSMDNGGLGKGVLYVVSTPIGNLDDITLRALKILRHVDLIAAEDTRRTRRLLSHFDIHTPLVSYFEHNELKKLDKLLSQMKRGKEVALVSDAGTPGISDPGYRLIQQAIEREIPVIPVPGPSAVVAALSISGLPTDSFYFAGFLPKKGGKRGKLLKKLGEMDGTSILYESPHRLMKTLEDLREVCGDRQIAVTRELTKAFEEAIRGRISEVINTLKGKRIRGELTIVLAGKGRKKYAHS